MSKIYKFVPFQFFYNASTLKSLTKILKSCNNTFEFNSITGKKIIGRIHGYKLEKKRLYIIMDSNYENNVSKDIISNSTKKKVSQMKDSQTAVNNFTIIIDFGDTSKLQSFVSDSENPIGLMYVVFNGDYKVTTNVVSYLEHDTDL